MGDRANVFVPQNSPNDVDGGIFLYTHWGGSTLPLVVRDALKRGESRWDDEPYLTRIIFSEMIKENVRELTGYGISTYVPDNEHPIIEVDSSKQTVRFLDQVGIMGRVNTVVRSSPSFPATFQKY